MFPDTDRDYTYEELLQRAFGQLRVRNPEMMGEKKKFVMKPPQVSFLLLHKNSVLKLNISFMVNMIRPQPYINKIIAKS